MKEKIIIFVIGILVGAVVSTGAFYVYTTINNSCNRTNQNMNMNNQPPQMPSGQNSQNTQPPQMPNANNTQDNSNTQQNNN